MPTCSRAKSYACFILTLQHIVYNMADASMCIRMYCKYMYMCTNMHYIAYWIDTCKSQHIQVQLVYESSKPNTEHCVHACYESGWATYIHVCRPVHTQAHMYGRKSKHTVINIYLVGMWMQWSLTAVHSVGILTESYISPVVSVRLLRCVTRSICIQSQVLTMKLTIWEVQSLSMTLGRK